MNKGNALSTQVSNQLRKNGAVAKAAEQVWAQIQSEAIANQVEGRRPLKPFTVKITNTDVGAVDRTIALFNQQGLIDDVTGGFYDFQQVGTEVVVTVSGGTSYAALAANVATNPMTIAGFQLQTNDALQFNETFTWYVGQIGQPSNGTTLQALITGSQNPGYFQGNILPIRDPREINGYTGLAITIGAGNTLSITFAPVSQK